jgi:uncharacterized delta-60 repeat protein
MSWVYKIGLGMSRKILNSQKKIAMLSLLIVASSLFSIPSASAAIGDLDTSFDGDGIVTTNIGSVSDTAESIALQSDGKIVAAGYFYTEATNYDFTVVRYNTDGSLDTSFSGDGIVTTDITGSFDFASSIAIQSDGKIVVAGYAFKFGFYDFAVVRYNTDGSLDTSFSGDGIVTTAIGDVDDLVTSVLLQSDGKIVAAGYTYDGATIDFAVVRYNTDGSLDTTFNAGVIDGIVTTGIGASQAVAESIALQSDGKIVAAGYAGASGVNDFAVVRYNTDGSLDTSFSGDGIVTTAIGAFDDRSYSIALQSDGKIITAGSSSLSSYYNFALVRYNADGTLDTSFNGDGIVTTDLGDFDDIVTSVVLQSDGMIVAAGHTGVLATNIFALVRYNSNGSPDTTFSGDGIVKTTIGGIDDRFYSIALQSDGKIVAAGASYAGGTSFDFALVRYIASDSTAPAAPTLNSVTAGDRRVTISFTAGANNGAAITDYEYSLNGGTYTSAGTTTSPFTITGLSGRTAYSVTIKARNSVGLSTASLSLTATTTDASLDASEAAAETARIDAANIAAQKAKEQKELTEILAIIPKIAELTLGLGETTKSLYSTKCVKGKTTKYVKYGAKCPKGYKKKK